MFKLSGTVTAKQDYSGKSKFEFWKDVKEGDVLEISLTVKKENGIASSGMYVPVLELLNTRNKLAAKESYNNLCNYLVKIGL